ncbi:uncharacterized protein [Clytia hemisphaerica]|uniref:Uncharacterized protein n=1 Tax=Clytia hemisphaerica TaxID=252671 RepID=A0A7M5UFP3_9CNID|eukprot:TCONS_00047682-protein
MGKLQSTKVIRVWILGATLCATIFVALSLSYDFWAMKTILDTATNEETTTYFGLWNKCEDKRAGNAPEEPLKPLVKTCEPYGNGNMVAGFEHPPEFMRITRGLLIPMTVILGVATIVIATVMYLTQRPLVTYASLPLLLGSIIGIIVLGVFAGSLDHEKDFKTYSAAWCFYYFLIAWFFTISAFLASLTDRN